MTLAINDYLIKATKNPDGSFTVVLPTQAFQVTAESVVTTYTATLIQV